MGVGPEVSYLVERRRQTSLADGSRTERASFPRLGSQVSSFAEISEGSIAVRFAALGISTPDAILSRAKGESEVTVSGGTFRYDGLVDVNRTLFEATDNATIMLLPYVAGDYDGNGTLDVADVDLQSYAMSDPDPDLTTYDEDDDGLVDGTDRLIWVHDHAGTWLGDANLNGEFNSGDMVRVFTVGKYETGQEAGWTQGDWNGDGIFDSSDMFAAFADGGYEKGPRADAAAVPEPGSAAIMLAATCLLAFLTKHRR